LEERIEAATTTKRSINVSVRISGLEKASQSLASKLQNLIKKHFRGFLKSKLKKVVKNWKFS
jgi:hypothetical protein